MVLRHMCKLDTGNLKILLARVLLVRGKKWHSYFINKEGKVN